MEVKCPRCRFRFEMPATPGETVLQCFCPRCGHPFSYDLSATQTSPEAPIAPRDSCNSVEVTPPPISPHREEGGTTDDDLGKHLDEARANLSLQKESDGTIFNNCREGREGIFASGSTPQRAVMPPAPEKKHGCFRRFLLLMAGLAAAVFLMVRYCDSEKHYSAHDVNVTDGSHPHDASGLTVATQGNDEYADSLAEDETSSDEKLPSWVEGSWHADTEFGSIDVTIDGNTISETDEGETCKGTFRYRRNILYCDFGDGQTYEYRLDPDSRRIDAGQGIYMSKAD